jgi:hypothetical protein
MLLTGSSRVLVSRGGRESLAGRALTTDFPTFQFREVVEAWKPDLVEILPAPVRFSDLFSPQAARTPADKIPFQSQQRLALQRALERYYNRGGYPRLHSGEVPDDRWADYLVETVFDRVLGVDIPDLFPVTQPQLLRHLYLMVARGTGRELSQVSLTETANAAGFRTNQPTVGKYLHYLADALLVREFRRFPLASRGSARVPAKITLTDLGVRNAILRGAPSLWESSPDAVGHLIETLVQAVIRGPDLQVHYFREFEDPRNRRSTILEVDFVAEGVGGDVLPVEVKFRRDIQPSDSCAMRQFIARYRAAGGIMVTRDHAEWDANQNVAFVPLLDFLVRLGV